MSLVVLCSRAICTIGEYHGYQVPEEDRGEDEDLEEAGCPQCQERAEACFQEGLSLPEARRGVILPAGFCVSTAVDLPGDDFAARA